MFRKRKDMQGLINSSRKSLQEAQTDAKMYKKLFKEECKQNTRNNKLLTQIKTLVECNNYGRPDIILNKIKELVYDYQSQN